MILNYFQLIDLQARMKMKAQANKLILSYLWWVLEPLLLVCMFYVVFGFILQRGGEDFFVFLIVGKITFMWFSKSVVSASTGITQNKGIIGQRALPKWIFPMVNIQESLYKSFFSFIIMFAIVLAKGYSITWEWLQLIPLTLIMYVLICGLGILLSILVCIAKDFSNIISLAMLGLMFGSGVFWDVNKIQNQQLVDLLLTINPVLTIISSYRDVIMYGHDVNFQSLLPATIISSLLLLLSLYIMSKFDNKITRMLFS